MKKDDKIKSTAKSFFFYKVITGFLWYFKTWHPYRYGFYLVPPFVCGAIIILFTYLPYYIFVELLGFDIIKFILPFFTIIGIILGFVSWGLIAYYLFLDNEL
jgi:hypothetical protein